MIALVLIGGYIVIQSIFRISISQNPELLRAASDDWCNAKSKSSSCKAGGTQTPGIIRIVIGTVLGICGGFLLFSKGFNAVSYVATVILTLISSWIMVSVSIRKPVKIAAGISRLKPSVLPPAQKDIWRKKNISSILFQLELQILGVTKKDRCYCGHSLSLGVILLVVSSIVLLRSPEALARQFSQTATIKNLLVLKS